MRGAINTQYLHLMLSFARLNYFRKSAIPTRVVYITIMCSVGGVKVLKMGKYNEIN